MFMADSTLAEDFYAEANFILKFPTYLDKYSNRKQTAKGELMIHLDAESIHSDAEYLLSE